MSKRRGLLRGWKLPIVAAAGVVFALFMIFSHKPAPAREPVAPPPSSPYVQDVAGIGVVEPQSEFISIGTELSGVVREVHVKVGDKVEKGAPLFSLDSRDTDASIDTLKASRQRVEAELADAKAQYSTVLAVKDPRAVSTDEMNKRKYAVQIAEARLREIKAQLVQAETNRKRLSVTAPIDGEVLSVNVRAGEFASAGVLVDPLMRMGDTSVLHVRVEVDEENASRIHPEAEARGMPRGRARDAVPLTFVRFEPYVRPKQNLAIGGQRVDTRVVQVIYAMNEIPPGMFVGQQMDVFINADAPAAAPANVEQ